MKRLMLISIQTPRGGGTWVEDTKGRVLVAWDEEDHQSPVLIGLGEWKGSSTVTLTVDNLPAHHHTGPSHTHTYAKANATSGSTTLTVNQIPSHTHSAGSVTDGFATHLTALTGNFVVIAKSTQGEAYTYRTPGYTGGGQGHTHSVGTTSTNSGAAGTGNTGNTGKNVAFSVVQPSIGVRRWHRTA